MVFVLERDGALRSVHTNLERLISWTYETSEQSACRQDVCPGKQHLDDEMTVKVFYLCCAEKLSLESVFRDESEVLTEDGSARICVSDLPINNME